MAIKRYKYTSSSFVIIILTVLVTLSGCSASRYLVHSFKSTKHFIPHSSDSRIIYEPGAEEFASLVASELPQAIWRVETGHYTRFDSQIIIHVCKSPESYKNLTGNRARAIMYRKKIFLSPSMMDSPDTISLYLAHELSHLIMIQKTGGYKYIKVPSWFHEGMAAFVSEGGGAHKVTHEEAINSIRNGKHFLPHATAGIRDIFSPRYASYWKLNHHMFYRQSMIFVEYLKSSNENSLRTFLADVQNGNSFKSSFMKSFGITTMEMWDEFVKSISLSAKILK
ncbi:MAG: hypothetical protein H8D23_29965 [Candidatus Brocadiales bacterium]|nr:hypothetical protein [Candidatus Brocadiales bacterium]